MMLVRCVREMFISAILRMTEIVFVVMVVMRFLRVDVDVGIMVAPMAVPHGNAALRRGIRVD